MKRNRMPPGAIITHTGTTEGFEHYHGTITIMNKSFIYGAMPKRCGVGYYNAELCLHAWSLDHLARKIYNHLNASDRTQGEEQC